MRRAAFALIVLLSGLAAGCGGDGAGEAFSVTRPDGSKIEFSEGFEVFCGPWEEDVAVPSLHVWSPPRSSLDESNPPQARFLFTGVLDDLETASTIRFPHSFVFSKPSKGHVFVYDGKTKNEAGSDQEEAGGSLTVRSFSCEKREAELEFDEVVLGSEFSDGGLVRLSGRLRVGG